MTSASKQAKNTFAFEATGTKWLIAADSRSFDSNLTDAVKSLCDQFEAIFSRFREDSLAASMERKEGDFAFPSFSIPMFALYKKLEHVSEGSFTPLIGKTLSEAGYDTDYSLKPSALTRPTRLEDVMKISGSTITTSQPVSLDFGAAGKGLLVDMVASLLKEHGEAKFTINAGGDLYTTTPIDIGLENPLKPTLLIGKARISKGAFCGSSGNRRDWGKFHHIIDGTAQQSPRNILATWTSAPSAMLADAASTALFLLSPDIIASLGVEYLIIYKDGRYKQSKEFPGNLQLS